jgi:hypothetical protein
MKEKQTTHPRPRPHVVQVRALNSFLQRVGKRKDPSPHQPFLSAVIEPLGRVVSATQARARSLSYKEVLREAGARFAPFVHAFLKAALTTGPVTAATSALSAGQNAFPSTKRTKANADKPRKSSAPTPDDGGDYDGPQPDEAA